MNQHAGKTTQDRMEALAHEWIEAWNAHDLDRIMSHYADDIVLTSEIAQRRLNDPRGTVTGKEALRAYFGMGLEARPDLHFTFRRFYRGVNSLVLEYVAADGRLGAEFMVFDQDGRVCRVAAHYTHA